MLQEDKEVPQSGQHTSWEHKMDGTQQEIINKKGKIGSHTGIISNSTKTNLHYSTQRSH